MSAICPWCGGTFDVADGGVTHAYMLSSSGCWAAYGSVLEREYSDPSLFEAVHRLTVDAYAVQHPGEPDERRALQSFWIHGASLWLVLRMGVSHRAATLALKALAGHEYPSRPEQPDQFDFTHADLLAKPVLAHREAALAWGHAALDGWRQAHPEFERMAKAAMGD